MSPDDEAEAIGHPSSPVPNLPPPGFGHLRRLTDRAGLWEHAELTAARREHGFCTEDNARALVVVSQQASCSAGLSDLASTYLGFVLEARTASGGFRNRRAADSEWTAEVASDDSQGRAWWGLGAVARSGPESWMREAGAEAFAGCASFESPHLRANAYAALGAAGVLAAEPTHTAARDLLERTSGVIANAASSRIPWPEDRLTYDNARLPEALIVAGATLGVGRMVSTGLRLLEWLVEVETSGDHYSFTPADGWTPGDPRPAFDQQPLEAWAMAAACHRASFVTGDRVWRLRAVRAGQWLMGRNDTGMVLYDRTTGGTFDGLMVNSVNQNQGAESTIAGIGALQVAVMCAAGNSR